YRDLPLLPQDADLPPQPLQLGALLRRRPLRFARVDRAVLAPLPQRLDRDAQPLGRPHNGWPELRASRTASALNSGGSGRWVRAGIDPVLLPRSTDRQVSAVHRTEASPSWWRRSARRWSSPTSGCRSWTGWRRSAGSEPSRARRRSRWSP